MSDPVPLREYIDIRLEELDKRQAQRFLAQEIAIQKSEESVAKHFHSVNKFRQTLTDQTKNFASAEKVEDLSDRFNKNEGRTSYMIFGASILSSIIGFFGGKIF